MAFLVFGLGVIMNLVLALAGALLLSLVCERAEAQVAREAFYSIPSETVSAADFLMGKRGKIIDGKIMGFARPEKAPGKFTPTVPE